MHKNSVPRLRFQGFAGEWEERKIIDFSPLQRGFDLPVSQIVEGDYPVVFSNGILKTHNQYKVKGVGVVTGRSGTIGEVTFVEKDFWPHNTALWVTNFFDNDPQFVFQFLKNFDLSRFATGSGVPTLNRNDVHDQIIYTPKREEQTALGNFFRRLDETLAQERARLAKTQQLKRAMLAKLFPQHGETAPKLRFKGFSGDWERKVLGDVSTSYSGGTPSVVNSQFYGGEIPFIRSGEIHKSKTELFITKEGLENSSARLVEKGNILYALYGATSGEVGRSQINGAINQAILAIIPNKNYDSEFISQWLAANKENIVNLYLQGGQGNLSGEIVKKIGISFPPPEEQTAIGNFFQKLDQTLALQTAELEKLTRLKKALLAAMLV